MLHTLNYLALAELWIFADMMLDHELCNAVADITFTRAIDIQRVASPSTLNFIWNHTSTNFLFRRLHVDIYTSSANVATQEIRKTELPHDFVMEVGSRYMRKKTHIQIYRSLSRKSKCSRYHVHQDGDL